MVNYLVTIEAELNIPTHHADEAEESFRNKLSSEIAWALSNADDSLLFETIGEDDLAVSVYSVELTNGDLDEVIQDRDDYPEFFVEGRVTFVLNVPDDSLTEYDITYYLESNIPTQVDDLELMAPTVELD